MAQQINILSGFAVGGGRSPRQYEPQRVVLDEDGIPVDPAYHDPVNRFVGYIPEHDIWGQRNPARKARQPIIVQGEKPDDEHS